MSDTFDASAFLRGLNLADLRVQRGALSGMLETLKRGVQLAVDKCPIDQSGRKPGGTLAASIAYEGPKATGQAIEGLLTAGGGEASDYAWYQHEETLTHTHPVSGVYASKYIEGPLKELTKTAPPVIAAEIRKELGGGA